MNFDDACRFDTSSQNVLLSRRVISAAKTVEIVQKATTRKHELLKWCLTHLFHLFTDRPFSLRVGHCWWTFPWAVTPKVSASYMPSTFLALGRVCTQRKEKLMAEQGRIQRGGQEAMALPPPKLMTVWRKVVKRKVVKVAVVTQCFDVGSD